MMTLNWQAPKYSMHGDMVELVASYPYGPYLVELGATHAGGYRVECCDHEGKTLALWWATFPTADEAKAFADRRAQEAERYGRSGTPMYRPFIDPYAKDCRCPYCGEWATIRPGDKGYDRLVEIDADNAGLVVGEDGSGPYRWWHPACLQKHSTEPCASCGRKEA